MIRPRRLCRNGLHPSIDHRLQAKAGDPLGIGEEPPAQRSMPDRCMYHMIAAKSRADLARRQHAGERHPASHGPDLAAPVLGRVERFEQQGRFSGARSLAHLLEPADREPGPTGEPDRIMTALRQQRLDVIR